MKKYFLKSDFLKNFSILLSGNIIGQAIALLVYPVLTRVYTEADFGVFSLFSSIVSVLSIICTGKYEEAIIVTNSRFKALNIVSLTTKLTVAISLLLLVTLAFFHNEIFSFLNMRDISRYWLFIPVAVFLTSFFLIMNDLANRNRKYKLMSSSNVILNSSSSGFKLLFGFTSFSHLGLIAGNCISQFLSLIPFVRFRKDVSMALSINWAKNKEVAKEYSDFPKYSMTRNLVHAFSVNLPFLILTGIFGKSLLGLFSLALMLGFRPVSLITNSLFQIFFEKISTLKNNNEKIFHILKKYWLGVLITLPCFVILYFISPSVISFVFGAKWYQAGVYYSYMLPWIFMTILSSPFLFLPAVFSKQNIALLLEALCLTGKLAVLFIGIYLDDFKLLIILYSILCSLYSFITFLWYFYLAKKYEYNLKK